jgi:pimeloyl-ACP methyl ester carboxylesterase
MTQYETLEHGQGVPLVMFHGLMGRPRNWEGLFPHLPKTCRAVALEIPFFKDGYKLDSVQAVTDYARGFLEEADFPRMVLAGNSLGGHIGLNLAIAMPQRVCGLVLTASSGLFERHFTSFPGTRPPREWVYNKMCEIFHDPAHATDALVDEVCQTIAVRRNLRDLVRIAKSAKSDNVTVRLGQVTCPSLLIWGRQDTITPPGVAEEFHQHLRGSELVFLDNCCHAPMIEHPREFAEAMGAWWDRRVCPHQAPVPDGVNR